MHDIEKANYIGNKRRLAEYIVKKFPGDGKTIFDCTCGCSSVLIEAAKNGYRVQGNDLSIVPYWYSKGVFEGAAFSETDIENFVNSTPKDGWLTTEWKGMYPRKREIRRYIDGLARKARLWQGPKGLAAKAVASRTHQTLYSDSISGYSTRRYEELVRIRELDKKLTTETTIIQLLVRMYKYRTRHARIVFGEPLPKETPLSKRVPKNIIVEALKVREFFDEAPERNFRHASQHFKVSKARISQLMKIVQVLPEDFVEYMRYCNDETLIRRFSGKSLLRIAGLKSARERQEAISGLMEEIELCAGQGA